MRKAKISRRTKETDIKLSLALDGDGACDIKSGIGFFDHMLTAFALHGGFDLSLSARGDLDVDCHHTVEDAGICLGQAFSKALGNKRGIARFGSFFVPMDESLAFCAVDISGRPHFVADVTFYGTSIGGMDTQMVSEFFRALAMHAGITLHIRLLYGENDHHKAEAIFKAVGHALKIATRAGSSTLSTKGFID